MHIVVIDLNLGNLRSVVQALKTVAPQAEIEITSQAERIGQADKVVLPGQGAIGTWFNSLRSRQLEQVLLDTMQEKPMLGICVGMQAMFRYCEEDGGMSGLDLFDGSVRHFKHFHKASTQNKLKIPQMGWNRVQQTQAHPLWQGIEQDAYFYFVHSYCANLSDSADTDVVFGQADFGHEFIAAVGQANVFAVQFHPEKSHQNGLRLLKNFTEWDGTL